MFVTERRSKEKISELEIYTDGSLKKIGTDITFGGWSFIVIRDIEKIYEESGGERETTSQRMELTAIVNALNYADKIRKPNERVIIYSDSAYAINCFQQHWYEKWIANGWKTSARTDVLNRDLWEKIIPYFDNFWFFFEKVKGHANVFWNEQCDMLAQNEAEKQKTNWRGIKNG